MDGLGEVRGVRVGCSEVDPCVCVSEESTEWGGGGSERVVGLVRGPPGDVWLCVVVGGEEFLVEV